MVALSYDPADMIGDLFLAAAVGHHTTFLLEDWDAFAGVSGAIHVHRGEFGVVV